MYTVLGASGFIGAHLIRELEARGESYGAPSRDEPLPAGPLGHLIYCVGVTADFRRRPLDTVEAHVCHLKSVLGEADFESLLYLSSTRVYLNGEGGSETSPLGVTSTDPDGLYNLSKLMGESMCLGSEHPSVRVVRLSNVYGPDFGSANFLSSIIGSALEGQVNLRSSLESAKDYVHVADVVGLLPRIAEEGKSRLYNVASGVSTSNADLLEIISRETGCAVEVNPDAEIVRFPPVSIALAVAEFGFNPTPVLDALPELVAAFRGGPSGALAARRPSPSA